MELKLNKTVKHNPHFFDMKLATKTFKKLMEKQIAEKKLKSQKINSSKIDHFFVMVNKDFFKQDIKEKDQEYIQKEVKRIQKYRQKMFDLYGKNALNRMYLFNNETTKNEKKLLFNPYQNENNKDSTARYQYDNIFVKEKIKNKTNLPFIYRKTNTIKLIKNNLTEDDSLNKSKTIEKNAKSNISRYNSLNTESSSKYPKQYLTYKNTRNNNSKISNFSERTFFNRNEYLKTLDNLYEETIYNHKKQKQHFNSCDYGCSFYINKCLYVTKNLFNK